MACPGSVRLSAGQNAPSSADAIEGTHAHTLGEICLRTGADPLDQVGKTFEDHEGKFEVSDEMAEAVTVYVDYVRSICPGGIVSPQDVEVRVSLEDLHPDMFGTADYICYDPRSYMLDVVDYKNGSGHVVEVKDNPQALFYAAGARRFYPQAERLRITIVQPNAQHGDGSIRSEEYDFLDLLAFEQKLKAAAIATTYPDAAIVAGDHCKWCPAAAFCDVRRESIEALAQDAFGELESIPALSAAKLGAILRKADQVKDWIKAVEKYAQMQAQLGTPPEGFKVVMKSGHRKWADANAAEAALRLLSNDVEAMFTDPKLKTVAQMEKALGKATVAKVAADHISRRESAILVREEDPRPAVSRGADFEFGDIVA